MEQHRFLRYSLAVLLFLAISTSSTQGIHISANYDRADKQLKIIEFRTAIMLHCNFNDDKYNELEWTKNGVAVGAEPSLTGRHEVLQPEKKFIIEKPNEHDAGNYTCTIKGTKDSATFQVMAMVRAKLPSNTAVVEGEKLKLHCIVIGTDPIIRWTIQDNITIDEDVNRYMLMEDENKVKNAILVVNEAVLADRGNYTCEVTNEVVKMMVNLNPKEKFSAQSVTTFLRVKGKFAALWPFLGICAEVVILCAIILIYEKRRNKAEMEESDTDQSPEQKKKRMNKNYD